MNTLFDWFSRPDNRVTFSLLLFFTTYIGILLWVFWGKKRGKRLESYKNIPFEEGDDDAPQRKENDNE